MGTKIFLAQRPLMELPHIDVWSTDQTEIDALRSRVADIQANICNMSILHMLRIRFGYTSNRIDGSSFTQVEVLKFIKTGVTIGGKLPREHAEFECHDRAIDMVYNTATTTKLVNVAFVQHLHAVCMPARREGTDDVVAGLLKTAPNLTISSIDGKPIVRYFVNPQDCYWQLDKLLDWANQHFSTMPVLPFVTILHYNFVRIAPFPEHNGRMARLLVALFMLRRGYPPMYRALYLDALAHADRTEDLAALTKLFARSLRNTYQELIETQGLPEKIL